MGRCRRIGAQGRKLSPALPQARTAWVLSRFARARLPRPGQPVLGGELWFPRRAMQSLYFSRVAASAGDSPPHDIGAMTVGADLTERESEALSLMRQGLTSQQIADRLGISINTVKKHLGHAFEKRGLHNRRQLLG